MKVNCLCAETMQGKPYYYHPVDCYVPISDTKAVLISKDDSPILKKTIVRFANSIYGLHEFDLILDECQRKIGYAVVVGDEFKVLSKGEVCDLPDKFFNIWEPISEKNRWLYAYHRSPKVDVVDGDNDYLTSIFVDSFCYYKDDYIISKNRKSYLRFRF